MEVDTPVNTESDVAPDYPESDQNDMDVHDSEKLMPTFYPKTKLVPKPQDELAEPSISSNVVQAAPIESISFLPVRASTPNPTPTAIPTPDLDMLDQTSDSVRSVASHATTLNATNLLADDDASMVGANETIVKQMEKLQPITEEPEEEELEMITEKPDLVDIPEINGTSGSKKPQNESGSRDQNNDEAEWTIVSHKRSKK
jgi:hypothetical protein